MQRTIITVITLLSIWAAFKLARDYYFKPNVSAGEQIPKTIVQLKDGKELDLAAWKGKYVLLHFWGSWCGPCRRESPEIRTLYENFHTKQYNNADGFEILSIGIEKDESRWNSAIIADRLTWDYHTTELNGFESRMAKLYGIRQIPTLLLVGPDQRMIGSAQTPDSVKEILTEKIKQ